MTAMARLTVRHQHAAAAKNADLVIEAILRGPGAPSRPCSSQLEDICPPHTIFASNTSSISLTALAAATKRPCRGSGHALLLSRA